MANEEYVDLDELNQGAEPRKPSGQVPKSEATSKENPKPEQEKSQVKQEIKKIEKIDKTELSENTKPSEIKKEPKMQESSKQTIQPVLKAKAAPTKIEAKKIAVKKKKKSEIKNYKKTVVSVSKSKKTKVQKKEERGKSTNWTIIALFLIAAVIIGVIVYLAVSKDLTISNKERVVAVVNGEPIYKSDITNRYNLLSATMDPFITQAQILNLTIMDVILVQEAKKRGITTSDVEVKNLMEGIMQQNGIDEESLKQDLASKNVSYEYILKLYKNTLSITKLMNSSFTNLSVSDEELTEFYSANKEFLKVPDMVQARHILFLFGEEAETDTYNRAKEVEALIKSDRSNFCDLVFNYTEDLGSAESCGEYNFSIDYPFVPEFLEAGFDMKPGEVRTIKTQLGYHIMYKVASLPGYTPSLEDISSKLETILLEDKTLAEYKLLLDRLQKEAIIEIYSESVPAKTFKEITASKELDEESVEEVIAEDSVEGEVMDPLFEESQDAEVTKELVSTPESKLMVFANCLRDKNVRMFTASWSPDSKTQLDLFENYASSLTIVECDASAKDANVEECSAVLKKTFPTWPTWEIDGVLYEGIQSLNALSRYSGCQY
ncbi:MAG: peptidylprolyl isomerase [Candidatus Nanoarchaeia archaeon]